MIEPLYDKHSVVCHAPGDRCLGCDHYKGLTDKCSYAVPECGALDPDAAAKALFAKNAAGYRNATPWDELHEDTRQIWRDEAKKRGAVSTSGLREALQKIANLPDEGDEWEGVDRFREARDIAHSALSAIQERQS